MRSLMLLGLGCIQVMNSINFQSTPLVNWNRDRTSKRIRFLSSIRFRGGASVADSASSSEMNESTEPQSSTTVLVSSVIGSTYLDKKKKLIIPSDSSVSELKLQIQKKFPGSPPVEIQRLVFGLRLLEEHEIISNISTVSPLPIVLDTISGTSAYNKTMTVSQALEAYSALTVHQAYLGEQIRKYFAKQFDNIPEGNNSASSSTGQNYVLNPLQIETALYRQMFDTINATLYQTYSEDINEALEAEKEPDVASADTAAWRSSSGSKKRPLAVALAKEFDLNGKGLIAFIYYSILLAVFAWFGTTSQLSSNFLLWMVPLLWFSKLRQLRLIFKLAMYLVLPLIPHIEFLMPLLPAPYQVIAVQSASWPDALEEEEGGEGGVSNIVRDLDEEQEVEKQAGKSTKSNGAKAKSELVGNKKDSKKKKQLKVNFNDDSDSSSSKKSKKNSKMGLVQSDLLDVFDDGEDLLDLDFPDSEEED